MALGVVALEVRAFEGGVIRMDADPCEGIDDALVPLGPVAIGVGVLDAQHERAAKSLGERPVVERGAGTAHVEVARG